jgi:hypothetical protein
VVVDATEVCSCKTRGTDTMIVQKGRDLSSYTCMQVLWQVDVPGQGYRHGGRCFGQLTLILGQRRREERDLRCCV